jgi:phosphoglycolate phosphatase-like HAD superfamily hydrolase
MAFTVAEGLEDLRAQTPDSIWCIVSGGNQGELRAIFAARGPAHLFDSGIYGSPNSKESILMRELLASYIRPQSLFLGDSRYDHEVSAMLEIDFLFVSG